MGLMERIDNLGYWGAVSIAGGHVIHSIANYQGVAAGGQRFCYRHQHRRTRGAQLGQIALLQLLPHATTIQLAQQHLALVYLTVARCLCRLAQDGHHAVFPWLAALRYIVIELAPARPLVGHHDAPAPDVQSLLLHALGQQLTQGLPALLS